MKKVELFPHNENGYSKLTEALKKFKFALINHATGTGKSFIALKYLYEMRQKKYLYLSPTYPIIEQLLASTYKIGLTPEDINIDTMIYRNLLKIDIEELYEKYDGFVLDEAHRGGSKKVYKKLKELILLINERNEDKKVIGLTATPIRYLDNERNMAYELFEGNVVSEISLSEAMLEGLLPVPIYINSNISCRDEFIKVSKRVSQLLPSKEKWQLERKLEKIGKNINNGSEDIKNMLNKHIQEKNGKYIIFCESIEALGQYYDEADRWFSGIGEIKKYKVHSEQYDKENKQKGIKLRSVRELNQYNLDSFNNDKDGISVLFCVDVLNEGVHVEGIDGVILLRKTSSPIIFFQQIGRALSFSGRNKQIKIFDLKNNFGNYNAIEAVFREFHEEMQRRIELYPEKAEQYKSISKIPLPLNDKVQMAYLGLIDAVDKFNPELGFKFSTYACKAIYRRIFREVYR